MARGYLPEAPLLALKADPYIDTRVPIHTMDMLQRHQDVLRERGIARDIGESAAAGDYLGAAQRAFGHGQLQTGAALQKGHTDRRLKLIDAMIQAGRRAETPEAYNAYVQQIEGAFGPGSLGELGRWENRLGGMTKLEKLKQRLMEAQIGKAQSYDPRPSAIRAWDAYKKMPPEEQTAFAAAGGKIGGAPTTNIYTGDIPAAKGTIAGIQKNMMDSYGALASLKGIARSYRPKMLKYTHKGKMWWLGQKAKLPEGIVGKLTPEEKKEARDYATFRTRSVRSLNNMLKILSGVAVNPSEAKRTLAVIPNPDDGHVEFEAKLADNLRYTSLAIARYNYFMKQGFGQNMKKAEFADLLSNRVPLDDMPAFIKRRSQEIWADLKGKHPNMPDEMLRQMVTERRNEEFGIDVNLGADAGAQ